MQNLFSDLKEKTHNKHVELEHSAPFALFHNMMGNSASETQHEHRENYHKVLCVMREFHQHCMWVINDAVKKYPALVPLSQQFEAQAVLIALDNDLTVLNSNSAKCITKLQNVDVPSFETALSATISAMYVWLGSSMGANIISRRLSKTDYGFPTHYYQSMAIQAKAWPEFKQEVAHLLPIIIETSKAETHIGETLSDAIVNDANLWFEHLILLGKSTSLPLQTLS